MLKPVRVTAPATSPVSLDEMKRHVIIDFADDDEVLQGLIDAAVARLDGYSGILGRCLITQTWSLSDACFYNQVVRLPFPDVSSLVITYYDEANAEQTLDAAGYSIHEDARGAYVRFASSLQFPATYDRDDAVTYTLVAGYGEADDVPAPIKVAIAMLVDHFDKHRDGAAEIPKTVRSMVSNYIRVGL